MLNDREPDIWEYDGSYNGFLTLVHQAFTKKYFPETIITSTTAVESLFPTHWIETDKRIAHKINNRLAQRLRSENYRFIRDGFSCSEVNKERYLLDAIQIGLDTADLLQNHLGHPAILALSKSIRSLYSEVHTYTGFIRFEQIGELLYTQIEPKHACLPYLCPHFAERYPNHTIMIYDQTHRLLGTIDKGKVSFIKEAQPPCFEKEHHEKEIEQQWKTFLKAVTINERTNKTSQLTHLPKRYRSNMTEFQ
jgi:probable DNA metabolism protein